MKVKSAIRHQALLRITIPILALLALGVVSLQAGASAPVGEGNTANFDLSDAQRNDGLDRLPLGKQMVSMSTLIRMGLVMPQELPALSAPQPDRRLYAPDVTINWGSETSASGSGNGTPFTSIHPADGNYILVSGSTFINNSSNRGATWNSQPPPNLGGRVQTEWLALSPGQNYAYDVAVSAGSEGGAPQLSSGRSTDRGSSWATFPSSIAIPGYFNDSPYLAVDQNPASPYYGRLYVALTLLDEAGTGSYNTIAVRYSTDDGATFPITNLMEDPNNTIDTRGVRQWGSITFGPNGEVYIGWIAAICCGSPGTFGTANHVMWARSTDGGATFPVSGTVATDPAAFAVRFNDNGPAGFRWTPRPSSLYNTMTMTGDYMFFWPSRRAANSNVGAAVKFSRSTDGGGTWSAPSFAYNDPDPNDTQYMTWAAPASNVGANFLTFTSSVNNTSNPLAHFFMQTTDGGATWSSPFQLSGATYNGAGFMGDYESVDVGGYGDCNNVTVTAAWTDNRAGTRQYARTGTFSVCGGTPTATVSTPTDTSTPTSIATTTVSPPTATSTPTATDTATSTPTVDTTITPTVCTIQFTDVPPGHTFYAFIRCLACQGIIKGYPCGGTGEPCDQDNNPYFRPADKVTRGQLTKIVAISAGYNTPVSGQTFEDVQPGTTFYTYTEQLAADGVMAGYPCGQVDGEPCVPPGNRPYFRSNATATRGQITKIVSNAAGFQEPVVGQTFEDASSGSTFYDYIGRLANRGIVSGYPCGGPGEPCVPPDNLPYFRPNNTLTRGQASKIVVNTFFPGCNPPSKR